MKTKEIDSLINKAERLALDEIEKEARKILRQHKNLHEFIMCMGVAFFTYKNGETLNLNESYMTPTWEYRARTTFKYLQKLNEFIGKYDEELKLTGEPMRFTAHGKITKEW